jgi:hypothetical protein
VLDVDQIVEPLPELHPFALTQNGCREYIDPTQQVVRRDHLIEAKLVKQLPLIPVLPSHHRRLSCRLLSRNHCSIGSSSPFFDSIDPEQTLERQDEKPARLIVLQFADRSEPMIHALIFDLDNCLADAREVGEELYRGWNTASDRKPPDWADCCLRKGDILSCRWRCEGFTLSQLSKSVNTVSNSTSLIVQRGAWSQPGVR